MADIDTDRNVDKELELAEELAALHDEGEHTAECKECLADAEAALLAEFSEE